MKKHLSIQIAVDETYSDLESKKIAFSTRSFCNFIERKSLTFSEFKENNNIVFIISRELKSEQIIKLQDPKMIEIQLFWNIINLCELDSNQLNATYVNIMKSGLNLLKKKLEFPYREWLEAIFEFEGIFYKNEWVQSEAHWRSINFSSNVTACLTVEEFILTQVVHEGHIKIDEKIIYRCKPREILFDDYLGRLILKDYRKIIYANKYNIISEFDIRKKMIELN
jgi:hypothetical protein